jgi:putative restriction endonuclease
MRNRGWTREELIVAFNLYCKIPFGKIHIRNASIIKLAQAIGRTPSSVSWKLANFARLDPGLKKRNISGASHGSKAEVEIWEEFNNDWERLSFESELLLERITGQLPDPIEEARNFPEGKSREVLVRTRVNQGFFRAAVLAAYNARCCITGSSVPQLLNASHIVPWSVDIKNRTNPRNGLCLNALHDRAFDCGLLTVTPNLKIKISPKMKGNPVVLGAEEFLWRYNDVPITPPQHFAPDGDLLLFHNRNVFKSS